MNLLLPLLKLAVSDHFRIIYLLLGYPTRHSLRLGRRRRSWLAGWLVFEPFEGVESLVLLCVGSVH